MKNAGTDGEQLPVASIAKSRPYPGAQATVGQFINLADEYCVAAYSLLSQCNRTSPSSSAPARLCAIHAVEMYLNAFLLFHGMTPAEVRGLQHNLAERAAAAARNSLGLRSRTQAHLLRIHDQREYLVVRYGPEQVQGLSELNRMFATLKEVSTKVRSAILSQPHTSSDLRFKKFW